MRVFESRNREKTADYREDYRHRQDRAGFLSLSRHLLIERRQAAQQLEDFVDRTIDIELHALRDALLLGSQRCIHRVTSANRHAERSEASHRRDPSLRSG